MQHISAPAPAYRWTILLSASAILAIAMGQLVNGLSAFFYPLEREFGWSRGEIALINTVGLVGLGLGGIVMGVVADRLAARKVALVGAGTLGACFIALSRSETLWQFYTIAFLAGALGGGSMFAPLFAMVGAWFRTGAGLAIGLASAGQAIGQGFVPLANAIMIDSLGWRGALLSYGIFVLATLVPLALLLRDPPAGSSATSVAEANAELSGLSVRRTTTMLSAAVLLCCSLMSVPLLHLVPLLQSCGVPAPQAGGVMSLMMITAIAGRIAFGKLADVIGAVPSYFIASAWQTLLVFFFVQMGNLTQFYVFTPIYAFGYAGVMTGVLTSIRSLTPVGSRASESGIVMAFAWFGHGLGGYVGGLLFDISGSYETTFAFAAASGVVNLAIVGSLLILVSPARVKRTSGMILKGWSA